MILAVSFLRTRGLWHPPRRGLGSHRTNRKVGGSIPGSDCMPKCPWKRFNQEELYRSRWAGQHLAWHQCMNEWIRHVLWSAIYCKCNHHDAAHEAAERLSLNKAGWWKLTFILLRMSTTEYVEHVIKIYFVVSLPPASKSSCESWEGAYFCQICTMQAATCDIISLPLVHFDTSDSSNQVNMQMSHPWACRSPAALPVLPKHWWGTIMRPPPFFFFCNLHANIAHKSLLWNRPQVQRAESQIQN